MGWVRRHCWGIVGRELLWAGSYYFVGGLIMGRGVFRAGLALAFSVIRPFLVALGNKHQPPALNIALACFKYRATCFKYRPPLITSLVYHSSYHLPTLSKNFTSTTPPMPKKGYHVRYHPPFRVARRIIWHFYYTLKFPPGF